MPTQLTEQPVRNAASFRDPSGFVFELDGRIFRALDDASHAIIRELRETGLLAQLVDQRIVVPTWFVEDSETLIAMHSAYPEAGGFVEHERIDPITYPYEWSPAMLADAGILTLDLQRRLLEHGFSLKDATAYNVQFVNGRPIFIDLASVERPRRLDVWVGLGQFNRMFTLPLLLNRRKGESLRSYFLADLDGRSVAKVWRSFGQLERLSPALWLDVTFPRWLERGAERRGTAAGRPLKPKDTRPDAQLVNLKRLRSKLRRLANARSAPGVWADYTSTCSYDSRATEAKRDAIAAFLGEFKPATVLDIGCNTGDYAMLAAEMGAKVIAVDGDPDCVDSLYQRSREAGVHVDALCVDLANPSPAIGFRNCERTRFLDRIGADCVLALALIHHLRVSANLPLTAIRDLLADMTGRYLVLEFVPQHDPMFRRLTTFRTESFGDWNLPNCIQVFADGFSLVRSVSVTGSGRTLLFWKREVAN